MELLEQQHVLIAPGSSFNTSVSRPLPDHDAAGRRDGSPRCSSAWSTSSSRWPIGRRSSKRPDELRPTAEQ